MKLNFNASACVRASSLISSCQDCIESCPVETIKITSNLPSWTPEECIGCGGCIGACPTSAFRLNDFDTIGFIFEYFQNNKPLSCKSNTPCLALFGPEELICLALGSQKDLILDVGHCDKCSIQTKLFPKIKANAEEANFILSSFCDKKTELQPLGIASTKDTATETNRRDFFSHLTPLNALKAKTSFENMVDANELLSFELDVSSIEKIRNKNIPDERKLLFALLKQQEKPTNYEVINSNDISFISQKYIDDNCTNCQMCYRICPTGALSSSNHFSKINFDAMLCIKCGLCHDVCEPNAIHLQPTFEIKEFFEPTQRLLAQFQLKRCAECGNHFTYTNNNISILCPRCQIEEDEAIMLHNPSKKETTKENI